MLALAFCAGQAAAQAAPPPPDTLKVDYFTYANTTDAPDATLHLTNPGTTGGNVCAAIFVFDSIEELSECCSCSLSPNDLRTLSVNHDLTSNPLVRTLQTGSISIVSTATTDGVCPLPTVLNPTSGGVRAWATHIDRVRFGPLVGYVESTAASQDATLSSTEENELAFACDALYIDGSGYGICSCGTGE